MSTAATVAPQNPNQVTNPTQGKDGNAWHEFDILAAVVSRYQNAAPKKPQSPEHRISCHRCGNIRKRRILCTRSTCPHTFCGRCAEKMKEEHGLDVFFGGCPVCKELCCCNNKSVFCHRKNHCYRKCPATKTNGKMATVAAKEDSDSEQYVDERQNQSIPKPENGQYGIFDLLAAVADIDKATGSKGKISAPASSSSAPRKKAKTGKDTLKDKDIYPANMLLCEPTSYAPYFSSTVSDPAGNMQLLGGKSIVASGDSGVDGYTFNNNTMGIIRSGHMNGMSDAISLMGQQSNKHKFSVGSMDAAMNTSVPSSEQLLSGLSATGPGSSTSSNISVTASNPSSSSAMLNAASMGQYSRLPSIENNPFSSVGARDTQRTPTFDQALLDSVRNIQNPPSNSGQIPSVLASVTASSTGDLPPPASTALPGAAAVQDLEPMNLLASVSAVYNSNIDKAPHSQIFPSTGPGNGRTESADA